MRYLSVCSGIEAATVAWEPLGWTPVAFSEIEKFPNAVLDYHYPDVPNWGDMNDFQNWPDADIDVLVGGTPCQSFSVAGLRQGMADPRGNLALVYLAIADQFRPRWLVWENVPGVLSSNGGRDFGAIIGGMVELGYSPAWRVLDAQYFGVPQRRRRVFVVASARDWRDSAKVLFEPESLLRHPAPSREAGQGVAGTLGGGSQEGGFRTTDLDNSGAFIPEVVGALSDGAHCGGGLNGQDAYSGRIIPWCFNWQNGGGYGNANEGLGITEDGAGPLSRSQVQAVAFTTGNSAKARSLGESEHVSPTLGSDAGGNTVPAVAFAQNQRDEVRLMDKAGALAAEPGAKQQTYIAMDSECNALARAKSGGDRACVSNGMAVRRLTPRECERLQGFPDDYTNIPGASDSGRYKALGNSMAVPVMRWLGERIAALEDGNG